MASLRNLAVGALRLRRGGGQHRQRPTLGQPGSGSSTPLPGLYRPTTSAGPAGRRRRAGSPVRPSRPANGDPPPSPEQSSSFQCRPARRWPPPDSPKSSSTLPTLAMTVVIGARHRGNAPLSITKESHFPMIVESGRNDTGGGDGWRSWSGTLEDSQRGGHGGQAAVDLALEGEGADRGVEGDQSRDLGRRRFTAVPDPLQGGGGPVVVLADTLPTDSLPVSFITGWKQLL